MKNLAPGANTLVDVCKTVVIYSDVDQNDLKAMPVSLHEEDPLAFPEPGFSCTAQLSNGQIVGLFYGTATRRLVFFPGSDIPTGDRFTVEAIISESNLPAINVSFRWDWDQVMTKAQTNSIE